MLRTFIAVKIAPTSELRRLHAQLAELGVRFRPTSLANLHVTLKFLGDTAQSQVAEIGAVVERIAMGWQQFALQLVALGAFPHERRPTVVWVGMTQAEPLCQIATELDTALIAQGFPTESRTFQPHLTLLRVKSRPPEDLFTLLSQESHTDFGRVVISHLELIESQLAHGGARYATLAKFALGP